MNQGQSIEPYSGSHKRSIAFDRFSFFQLAGVNLSSAALIVELFCPVRLNSFNNPIQAYGMRCLKQNAIASLDTFY